MTPSIAKAPPPSPIVFAMPSFDVVSEVDEQEVRNAVDQASRELANRFDFKGTDSSIELGEKELILRSATEDRLKASCARCSRRRW